MKKKNRRNWKRKRIIKIIGDDASLLEPLSVVVHGIKQLNLFNRNDLNKKYELNEIVKGDSIFCATGITSGDLVSGVKYKDKKFITETLVTHKNSMIDIVKKEVSIT